MYVYIYIYIHTHTYIYIYIYIYNQARQLADVANNAARKAEKGIDIDKLISQIGRSELSQQKQDELYKYVYIYIYIYRERDNITKHNMT